MNWSKTLFETLPESAAQFLDWPWERVEPFYRELLERPMDAGNVAAWLADWTRLHDLVSERYARLNLATAQDTSDEDAEARLNAFLDETYPAVRAAENQLKRNPTMGGGKITVQFKINPGGRVVQARVASNNLKGGSAVGSCITRAIRRWRFAQSQGYSVVWFPFLFSSGLK